MDQLGGGGDACNRVGLDLVGMDAVQKGAGRVGTIRVLVGQRRTVVFGIPAFAGNHAGMAADAGIKVDHKAEFCLGGAGQAGHALTFAMEGGEAGFFANPWQNPLKGAGWVNFAPLV